MKFGLYGSCNIIWDTFHIFVLYVNLVSFRAVVSNGCDLKKLSVERNGVRFEIRGVVAMCISGAHGI